MRQPYEITDPNRYNSIWAVDYSRAGCTPFSGAQLGMSSSQALRYSEFNALLEDFEMLKKRIMAIIIGLALLASITGVSGIVADSWGLDLTPAAYACGTAGSGGGC